METTSEFVREIAAYIFVLFLFLMVIFDQPIRYPRAKIIALLLMCLAMLLLILIDEGFIQFGGTDFRLQPRKNY